MEYHQSKRLNDESLDDFLYKKAKTSTDYPEIDNSTPIDHPMVDKDLYLYEIRMERERKFYRKNDVDDNIIYDEDSLRLLNIGRMFHPNSNGDDNCFGILSPIPLPTIAPFELYDSHMESVKNGKKYCLGIITVKIIPIKAMIRLDEKQIMTLEHFHRVVALVNGMNEINGVRHFYRDFYNDEEIYDAEKYYNYKHCRTFTQRYGHINYLFTPLSSGPASQFPWKGYDIDWSLVTDMLIFEQRMVKIYEAKYKCLSKQEKLKEVKKAIIIFSKEENPSENLKEKIKILENKREELLRGWTNIKGKLYYTNYHPLIKGSYDVKNHKHHFKSRINKVFFSPWKLPIQYSDGALNRIPLTKGSDKVKNPWNWTDKILVDLYPKCTELYTSLHSEIKDVDGDKTDDGDRTRIKTFYQKLVKGYKDNNDEWIPGKYPKLQELAANDGNDRGRGAKLVKIQTLFSSTKEPKRFISTNTDSFTAAANNRDDVEPPSAQYHFMEHLELFFLNSDMLRKSSRLLSISHRLSQMMDMELFRQFIVRKSYQESCANPTESSYNTTQFEKVPAFRIFDNELKCDKIKFIQKRTRKHLKPSYANRNVGDSVYSVTYSDDCKNLPDDFESNVRGLGLMHPIPIFGQKKYFLPPKMIKVCDTMAVNTHISIISESNEDKACAKIDLHVKEKVDRAWSVEAAHDGSSIGTIDQFKKKYMFKRKFGGYSNIKRDIEIDDQTSTLEKWQIRVDVSAKPGLEKIDCIEPDDKLRIETFKNHPAFIDWPPIIETTQNSILKLPDDQNMIESRERYCRQSLQDAINVISNEHWLKLYSNYLPSEVEMDIMRQFDDQVKDSERYLKNLISNHEEDDDVHLFLDEQIMGPSPSLLLRCFTQRSAGENQHHKNVQRMEFIGDSFLKLATTRVLFDDDTISTAGMLTRERTNYIKNANLRKISKILELENYMNIASVTNDVALVYPFFVPDNFKIDILDVKSTKSFLISEKQFQWKHPLWNGHAVQKIQDEKWVADTVESLIGAYLMTGGEKMAAEFLLVLNKIYREETDKEFLVCPEPYMWPDQDSPTVPDHIYTREFLSHLEPNREEQKNISKVEKALNEQCPHFNKFKNQSLAKQALSMAGYHKYDNERLEFLGDAVIDYVVAFEYYNNLSEYIIGNGAAVFKEGDLTAAKQAITSNNFLGSVGFINFLPHCALTLNSKLLSQFEDFKSHLGTKRGIPLNPDLNKIIDSYIPSNIIKAPVLNSRYLLDVPKWFGDIFEAVFGLVWLDQNQSLSKFWKTLKPFLNALGSDQKRLMELGVGEQKFESLNPRKHCEKEGTIQEDIVKLSEKIFVDQNQAKVWLKQKGGLREQDRIYIDKYVCRLKLRKADNVRIIYVHFFL